MEGTFSSSNQNQSKTLEESVREKLNEALTAYAYYLYTKSIAIDSVLEKIPQALPSLEKIIENLYEFGKCKNFLTGDQEALQKCIDEYNFMNGLLGGIFEYTIWKRKPEQIERFTIGLDALAKGGKEIIKDLHKQYQKYKTTSIPQEDIKAIRAIESLIIRYLENPEGYEKQLSKYLGKRQYLSTIRQALLALPEFIKYLGKRSGVKAKEEVKPYEEVQETAKYYEVKPYEELKEAAKYYIHYTSYLKDALNIVSEDVPKALPSLATLIENLEEWNGSNNLLTNDREALKEYADKYYFMANFMGSILKWWISKQEIPSEEIERFTIGLDALAKGGKEIIDGLYRLYKDEERTTLEKMLKDKNYQTINPYKLEEARASAGESIEYLLVNYFRNPRKHED